MKETLKFRTATVKDAALVARLGLKTFSQAFCEMTDPADFEAYINHAFAVEHVTCELRDPKNEFVLAFSKEDPAGYFKLTSGNTHDCVAMSPAIEIVRFYTLKTFWGKGAGALLMDECLGNARQKGFAAVWLSSWKKNDRGNAFYRKQGFEIAGEKTFAFGKDIQDDYVLVRDTKTHPVETETGT